MVAPVPPSAPPAGVDGVPPGAVSSLTEYHLPTANAVPSSACDGDGTSAFEDDRFVDWRAALRAGLRADLRGGLRGDLRLDVPVSRESRRFIAKPRDGLRPDLFDGDAPRLFFLPRAAGDLRADVSLGCSACFGLACFGLACLGDVLAPGLPDLRARPGIETDSTMFTLGHNYNACVEITDTDI